MLEQLWAVREQVKSRKPLVFNITNNVVTNFTANILLAAGASPIMSEGAAEAEALASISDVLVLNIGTLHTRQIGYCLKAGEYANKMGKPVVFDPVGVGATPYRNITAGQILTDIKVDLIRGNCGEVGFLAGAGGQVKGVDSEAEGIDRQALKQLASSYNTIVAATGPVDYVTGGSEVYFNKTGHHLLQYVTGTGCALSSLAGAFISVAEDRTMAVLAALTYYGAAAQKAAAKSKGPGSFGYKFIDCLHNLTFRDFKKYADSQVGFFNEAPDENEAEVQADGNCVDEARES